MYDYKYRRFCVSYLPLSQNECSRADLPTKFTSVVQDEFSECDNDVRLDGKVALVTGATSGTGLEVAKNFARRGAKVIIASRNPNKLATAREAIIQSSGNENVVSRQMDFESLQSIRDFSKDMYLNEPRLNILVNNIGVIGLEDKLTNDNLHIMMQVNYFGAFLLTFLLYPLLKSSAPSRIVNVSSLALILGEIDLDHINDVGRYPDFLIYCNAKLAEVLFTVEMNERIKGNGVNIYSMDPGLGKSEFFRHYNETFWRTALNAGLLKFGRPLDRVATMPVYLSVDPRVENTSGKHYRDCAEFYSSWHADDKMLRKRLWIESKRLVNITAEEDWERR